jgi:hypothetical protein
MTLGSSLKQVEGPMMSITDDSTYFMGKYYELSVIPNSRLSNRKLTELANKLCFKIVHI